jgi:hypothetical protein
LASLVSGSKRRLQLGAKARDLAPKAQDLMLSRPQPLQFFCGYLGGLWRRNRLLLTLAQPKPQALILTAQSQQLLMLEEQQASQAEQENRQYPSRPVH